MTERISSPEQLSSRMKITGIWIWIVLAAVAAAVTGGLAWFLSHEIVSKETHICYVSERCEGSIDALCEILITDTGENDPSYRNVLEEEYGEILSPYVQLAYLIIRDIDSSELVEGMPIRIEDNSGFVVFIQAQPTEYEAMLQLGMDPKEMRVAGLLPGSPYYLCPVFLRSEVQEPVMSPGIYTAEATLSVTDPVSLILK